MEKDMDINDIFDENEELGQILQSKYKEPVSQNCHIEYFYIILGNEHVEKSEHISDVIRQTPNVGTWGYFKTEWAGLLVGEFQKLTSDETERHREERLNDTIRKPLLTALALDPHNPPHIIISRVCKYTEEVPRPEIASLTTPDIERALRNSYNEQPDNQHIEYFYLIIRLKHVPLTMDIPAILSELPGEWVPVTPGETWPLTFIGYFPKQIFESERAREWRLHYEVRQPLKEALIGTIHEHSPGTKKAVIVLFTRACQYTKM